MSKSTFFSGQPVLSQILGLIPDTLIAQLVNRYASDRYYKTFTTRDHLICMLYACFKQCNSLRELESGLGLSQNKFNHLNLKSMPCRSTIGDANGRRRVEFFEQLYRELYSLYYKYLPDSRKKGRSLESRLFIMDATTVTLFSDVMKGVGCIGSDGRRKGGVKAHVLLNAKENVPQCIYISEGSRNDRVFMSKISLHKGDILVFDKGYHHFAQWQRWTDQGITWVTRLNEVETYETLEKKELSGEQREKGVRDDRRILLGRGTGPGTEKITVRLVSYYVPKDKKMYRFLTNNFRFKPSTVAGLYEDRWQVETFFKRLKQNNPLRIFLGNNENAIRIQLWCAFIKDLLVKVVKDQVKRKWAYSNISSMIHQHLMNYVNMIAFLNNPDKLKLMLRKSIQQQTQISLFPT